MTVEFTKENFEELVLKSEKPVMVDFWAPWCGPCKMLGPVVEDLANDNENKNIVIGKLSVDDNGEIASKFNVRGIPCVLFFKDGVEVEGTRIVGLGAKNKYQEVIDNL